MPATLRVGVNRLTDRLNLKPLIKKTKLDDLIELIAFPRDIRCNINGQPIHFTVNDLHYYFVVTGDSGENWWIEGEITREFMSPVSTGDVFFDLGANHGYYTIFASNRVGDSGKIVAFEPFDKFRAGLKANIQECSHPETVLVEGKAVGAQTKDAGVTLFDRNPRITESGSAHSVQQVALDDYTADCHLPDHIKIDVEGLEAQVLEGAENLLCEETPRLLVEVHGLDRIKEMGGTHKRIYDILQNAGYTIDCFWGEHFGETAGEYVRDCAPMELYEQRILERRDRHHLICY